MDRRPFVGRSRELASLRQRLDLVASDGSGVAVAIRGRRQVGKSRLVERFCQDAGLPYMYFQASRGVSPAESLGDFLE
ncbi:AAA family ATPase, partial [Phytoactinopolyspora endophytica]|uniref:AAA family ATPase n=1 Tax=Phytoactinopolyspora endophytica TaxID=1642495 RepID=UPI00197C80E9